MRKGAQCAVNLRSGAMLERGWSGSWLGWLGMKGRLRRSIAFRYQELGEKSTTGKLEK